MPAYIADHGGRPPADLVADLGRVPTTILSDMMNRMNAMQAAIKPVRAGLRLAGPALTVKCMVGDNIMTHKAITMAQAGDVLVVDGRAHEDTAIWGGLQTAACMVKKLGGVVVDGAVRDVAELREGDFPVFTRAATPAGPHKGWGGSVNEPIQCGGVTVMPGDIVIGDDDGVVVVAQAVATQVLTRALRRLEEETEWKRRVEAGESLLDILDLNRQLDRLGGAHA